MAMVRKLPPITPARQIAPQFRAVTARHARHIGEIAWAWNSLQANLFGIFAAIVSPENLPLAHGLWHLIQSDKTQREMVIAAAQAGVADKRMRDSIEWVCKQAERLSPHRNDAAHTPMAVEFTATYTFTLAPNRIAARKQAVDRLSAFPTEKIWRAVRGDLLALSGYAGLLTLKIRNVSVFAPSLRRPRLRSLPALAPKRSRKLSSQRGRQPKP